MRRALLSKRKFGSTVRVSSRNTEFGCGFGGENWGFISLSACHRETLPRFPFTSLFELRVVFITAWAGVPGVGLLEVTALYWSVCHRLGSSPLMPVKTRRVVVFDSSE